MKKEMSLAEYVHSFGYKVSDLTPEQLEGVKREMEAIKSGLTIFDGVLSNRFDLI